MSVFSPCLKMEERSYEGSQLHTGRHHQHGSATLTLDPLVVPSSEGKHGADPLKWEKDPSLPGLLRDKKLQ